MSKMKNKQQIMIELHDELLREWVEKRLEIDVAHLWEPLKKQDGLCTDLMHIEEKISLLEKRFNKE